MKPFAAKHRSRRGEVPVRALNRMPTPTGGETIGERLKRLRCDLSRVRETIARAENNGAANNLGGQQVTEIAHERACARATALEADILTLERRLQGSTARSGIAQLVVKLED